MPYDIWYKPVMAWEWVHVGEVKTPNQGRKLAKADAAKQGRPLGRYCYKPQVQCKPCFPKRNKTNG